jgi:hypothetical protein
MSKTEAGNRKNLNSNVILTLHQTVQSLNKKLMELAVSFWQMFCVLQNTGKRRSK